VPVAFNSLGCYKGNHVYIIMHSVAIQIAVGNTVYSRKRPRDII
jgi:hypothetical protein